jgi:putative methionine-R-sulfoxide reductase with GAF domain
VNAGRAELLAHETVLAKVSAALAPATDAVGAMARAVAVLKREIPDYSWVGIYLVGLPGFLGSL